MEIVSIFLHAICCVRSVFPLLVYGDGVESSYISRVGRIDVVLSHEDVLFFNCLPETSEPDVFSQGAAFTVFFLCTAVKREGRK